MARVEWTRLSGDEVEEIVAILLSRENRRATRIRPSQGDGGIDVIVPDAEGVSHVVYQIKKFSQNLGSSEKRQIANSYKRLTAYVAEQDISVSSWKLVMPLDPTRENYAWFCGITEGANFEVDWAGLIFVDGLAARYPDVIDYYAKDGKDRLVEVVTELTHVMSSGEDSPGPAAAISRIQTLHSQVNRWDPHYSYELMVTEKVPDISTFAMSSVLCVHQTISEERCVSIIIKARFHDAINVRPVPMTLRFNVQPDSPSAEALQEHLDFGTTLELDDGQVELSVDLPGGLGMESSRGNVRIVSYGSQGPGEDFLFEILSPTGQVISSATVVVESRVTGQTGIGGLVLGKEINGVFEATAKLNFSSGQSSMSVSTSGNFEGMRLEGLHSGISFLSAFHHPNRFRIRNPYSDDSPTATEISAARVPVAGALLEVVRSLLTIQKAAGVQIKFPGTRALTPDNVIDWNRAASLLRGEQVSLSWEKMKIPVAVDKRCEFLAQLPAALLFRDELTVAIGVKVIKLGTRQTHCAGVAVNMHADGSPVMDEGGIEVIPLEGYESSITLLDSSRRIDT
ncbi:restriction endonuclease [Streptomyces sp. DW26H14]|uniref:restriction endonuclease n=1 Tax=Streptomyces sp. DW26H14 TaxID=3435395 RepID=UPI00403DFAC1